MKNFWFYLGLTLAASPLGAAGLDVTITEEATGERRLTAEPPPMDLPFVELFPLNADGNRDKLLAQSVTPEGGRDRLPLLALVSRQTAGGLPGLIPMPLVSLEWPGGGPWDYQVLDQDGKVVYRREGGSPPPSLAWDGYKDGVFLLKPGEAYTPLLQWPAEPGRRHYGQAVRYQALRYEEKGGPRMEFANNFLFGRASAELSTEALTLWDSALDEVRRWGGAAKVTLFYRPREKALAQRRLDALVARLKEALETQAIAGTAVSADERGDLTRLSKP